MKIWLLGCEQPTNLKLADEGGAKRVGMSFHSLLPRLPKTKDFLVRERFSDHLDVYLASGGHSLAQKSDEAVAAFVTAFDNFVDLNAGRLSMVTEVDDPRAPVSRREEMRELLGDAFVPVWLPQRGVAELEHLAAEYRTVGIRAEDIRAPMLLARLNPLHARYRTEWHLLDGARPDELMTGRFHSAATTAWLAPMKNGETIVWDGVRMQRYPKRMRDQARRQHRPRFTQAGFNADEILEGDYRETTRYTVSAFVNLENYLSKRQGPDERPFRLVQDQLSTSEEGNDVDDSEERPLDNVDNTLPVVRNENRAPVVRSGGRQTLPVFGFERKTETEIVDGESVEVERLLARKGTEPLRQCDSCHVAATCPAFNPGHECAYELPLEIRTKDQLSAALAALLGKQMDRVAFMMMAEELNGGYADPNTSAEVKLFMDMVKAVKEIEDNRATFRMQVEAKGGAGVLSRLFGEKAKQLSNLDVPIPGNEIENIIDAEIVE